MYLRESLRRKGEGKEFAGRDLFCTLPTSPYPVACARMIMAGRPHLNTSNLNMHNNGEEEVMFNPAEHKDLAHFFSQVDQTETFALTANEWLGIRSGGEHFTPVGSVGPQPSRPNNALTSATRSLMAINTPVSISPSTNLQNTNGHDILAQQSAMSNPVRAWRPHETPFDPSVHTYQANEHEIHRRASTSSSNYHLGNARDRSSDAAGHRKRPAPTAHSESMPSKRPRSVSNSHSKLPHSYSDSSTMQLASGSTSASAASSSSATTQQQQQQQQHKPPLLTAQQKKANHILSEQKRRAKIRRGYEALCEVVPNLRAAVLAEQEAMDSKKKRGKAKGSIPGEGADGRAGPKSESVVLTESRFRVVPM